MALSFGWRANEVRESIWRTDPALEGISEAALAAWTDDGDASHLEPFIKHGQPTRIEFRTLNTDESRVVQSYYPTAANDVEAWARACLMCFRLGVNFQGLEKIRTSEGEDHPLIVRERGLRMLAEPFVADVERKYPGMVGFYGAKIFLATIATETEKKASSPPSTQTPLSEAASMVATTEPSPSAGAA